MKASAHAGQGPRALPHPDDLHDPTLAFSQSGDAVQWAVGPYQDKITRHRPQGARLAARILPLESRLRVVVEHRVHHLHLRRLVHLKVPVPRHPCEFGWYSRYSTGKEPVDNAYPVTPSYTLPTTFRTLRENASSSSRQSVRRDTHTQVAVQWQRLCHGLDFWISAKADADDALPSELAADLVDLVGIEYHLCYPLPKKSSGKDKIQWTTRRNRSSP